MVGSLYAWGGLNLFFISYLREFNQNITVNDGYFIMPINILSATTVTYLGAYLEGKYNPRL